MKKYMIKYISLALSAFVMLSCSDFLSQVPSDRLTEDQVFSTRDYSERYLAAIYTYIFILLIKKYPRGVGYLFL